MPIVQKVFRASTDSYAYAFDYSGFAILTGADQLVSAVVSATPAGLTLGSPSIDAANKKVNVNVSGGVSGVTYRVTCVATTTNSEALTGLLDVATNDNPMSGVVVFPSQLLPFIDSARAMELVIDSGELADNAPPPDPSTIDGNARAFALCQAAWRRLLEACARGDEYHLQELIDYANDPIRGLDLLQLVADIFWCALIKRRRYTSDEPQAKDATCEEAERRLQALREGERIFDLEGVTQTDGSGNVLGTYGDVLAAATTLHTGRRHDGGGGRDRRFWGDTGLRGCR